MLPLPDGVGLRGGAVGGFGDGEHDQPFIGMRAGGHKFQTAVLVPPQSDALRDRHGHLGPPLGSRNIAVSWASISQQQFGVKVPVSTSQHPWSEPPDRR